MAFYTCARFGSNSLLGQLGKFRTGISKVQYAQSAAVPKVSFVKFETPKEEHHDIRNERLKRPLSPHITIYKFPLPAVMSITHRGTGIMLTSYATVLGIGALVLPYDVSHYITLVESLNLSSATLFAIKTIIAAPFGYHFANGIRHLYWDTAKGLSMKEIYTTGYSILAVTLGISLILAAL